MKKYIIAFLTALCLACLVAAACGKTERYTLTFDTPDGVAIESEVFSGASVKKGYEVVFSLVLGEDTVGEPKVTANDSELSADEEGKYRFKITSDTTVKVTGVSVAGANDVIFEQDEDFGWVRFYDLNGEKLETVNAARGQEISFTVKVSVYYGDKPYSVTAGSSILTADENGVYTFTVSGATKVAVKGLEILTTDTFIERDGGDGDGTEQNPYKIKTPADLYMMHKIIAGDYYVNAYTAYYELANDIDLKGERLFMIGDRTTELSIFAGHFDGKGHTVSNYVMTDTLVEQNNFQTVHIPAVGFFGYAYAATILNLNLKNFEITANGIRFGEAVIAGGLVGYGIGVNIINCSADGTIIADGDSNYFSYAGGIIGIQQSFYSEFDETRYYSVIQSCSSDVDIRVESGYVYAAGGIAGYMISFEERTASAIVNAFSTGNVTGAMRAGGIAGQLGEYGTVKNCYATGNIEATNTIAVYDGGESNSYAYAGGLVGFAERDGGITESFFTGAVYASADAGANYEFKDGVLGGRELSGSTAIEARETVVFKAVSTVDTAFGDKVAAVDDGYIKNTLGWSEKDWRFNSDGAPAINKENESKTFEVTIQIGTPINSVTVTDAYIPMSYWYLMEDGIPEYSGGGAARTYGYYFDAALTLKVPFGYIPTDDITLYAAYADYTEVAGEYHLQGLDGCIVLGDDGLLTYRNGALSCVSTYIYDGETVWLYKTFLAILVNEEYDFYTFKAEVDGGVMRIYDLTVFTESNPVTAVKKYDMFKYGAYYGDDGNSYTFNVNGTGVIGRTSGDTDFTYTISGDTVNVTADGSVRTCTVENGVVVNFGGVTLSVLDAFAGEWEKSAGSHRVYSFDGKGNWGYEYFGYDADGDKVVKASDSGVYTIENGQLSFDGKTAKIENGILLIDNEKYYAKNSFVGTWLYSKENDVIEITFNGITAEGFGTANVEYSGSGIVPSRLDLNYEVTERGGKVYLALYYYYSEYGLLEYDTALKTLKGSIYLVKTSDIISDVSFCLYDDFKGEWTSGSSAITKVVFNGRGNYDLAGSVTAGAPQKGEVTVYTAGKTEKVRYTLKDGTLEGTFVFDGTTYNISFDEERGVVIIDGVEFTKVG